MAEVTEVIADVAEGVGEQAFEMAEVSRSLSGRDLGIGIIIGSVIGGAIGFWFTRKRLEKKYADIADQEIDEMRDHFRRRLVAKETKPEISDLGKRVSDLGYVAPSGPPKDDVGPGDPNTAPGVGERTESNVFDTAKVVDVWDWEVEKAGRDPSKPYVIHIDERGETGYEEVTLTYYTGDDVLCDHQDKVVDDQDRVVGGDNLDKFGHGSNDAVIVYVRNEYLNLDIEVVKSNNSYAEEVHGLTHADEPRRRERPQWN